MSPFDEGSGPNADIEMDTQNQVNLKDASLWNTPTPQPATEESKASEAFTKFNSVHDFQKAQKDKNNTNKKKLPDKPAA